MAEQRPFWGPDELAPDSDFSLDNIPFGIISTPDIPRPHVAVAIGTYALDMEVTSKQPYFCNEYLFPFLRDHADVFSQPTLNAFAALGREMHNKTRETLRQCFISSTNANTVWIEGGTWSRSIWPLDEVTMHLPMQIGDYTDFYAGVVHATSVGTMFRGAANALQPNYKHLPVGYHGRASSIVVSGTPIRRPWGQFISDPKKEPKQPETRPSEKLDFELELGCFVSRPNGMGEPIPIEEAEDYVFGYVLLNDWSARDVQAWEYVPLGPFNGKNFATTISPWVVLHDALKPFMTVGEPNDTELQPYLREKRKENVFDIRLEVDIRTASGGLLELTRTNAKHLLWSFPQMMAHHTVGGCPLRTGDLLGSGTISSVSEDGNGGGSLLELSENGKREVGCGVERRTFLLDGDTVSIKGFAEMRGRGRVGFGECVGRIESALSRE